MYYKNVSLPKVPGSRYKVHMYKKVAYNLHMHNPVKVVVDAFLKNRLEPHSKFVVLDDSLLC